MIIIYSIEKPKIVKEREGWKEGEREEKGREEELGHVI